MERDTMAPAFVFVPPAGFEANAELRPFPRSFVTFFSSTNDAASPAMTPAENDRGLAPAETAVCLSSRAFREALPAWHRVPKVAIQQPGRRRATIMKRRTNEQWRRCPPSRPIPWWDSSEEQDQQHPARRRRLRGGLGERSDVPDAQFAQASEDSSDFYTEAIVRTIDAFAESPRELFELNDKTERFGGLSPVVRQKRRFFAEKATRVECSTLYYTDLLFLVVELWRSNGRKIRETNKDYYQIKDLKRREAEVTNEVINRMSLCEHLNNKSEEPMAARGPVDLSAITDATEPDTTYRLESPRNPVESRSTAERKARLSAAMPTFGRTTAPINSSSSATPAPVTRPGTYALHYEDSSSADATTGSMHAHSPAPRPAAPTPSRGRPAVATTPSVATPHGSATPSAEHVDLGASRRASHVFTADTTPKSWQKLQNGKDVTATLSFADTSRDLNPLAETPDLSHVSATARRRSEPLRQGLLKDRATRMSLSPQKLFRGSVGFNASISTTHASPARSSRASIGTGSFIGDVSRPFNLYFSQRAGFSSPIKPRTPSKTPTSAGDATPPRYEINCMENLDIFGKKTPLAKHAPLQDTQSSPIADISQIADMAANSTNHESTTPVPTSNVAVEDLAKLASTCCGNEAKVFIDVEDDKLKVRFKLPTKYADLFPYSQGTETSHFSSELEHNNSPPIRFETKNAQGFSAAPMSPQRKALGRVSPRKMLTGSPLHRAAAEIRARMNLSTAQDGQVGQAGQADQADAEMDDTASHDGHQAPTMALDFATASQRCDQFGRDVNSTILPTPAQYAQDSTLHQTPTQSARTFSHEQQEVQQSGISEHHDTTILTPTAQLQQEVLQAPGSTVPEKAKPHMSSALAGHSKDTSHIDTPTQLSDKLDADKAFATASMHLKETAAESTPQHDKETSRPTISATPQATEAHALSPFKTSFTPVNKPASQREEARATASEDPITNVSKKTPDCHDGKTLSTSDQPSATKASPPKSAGHSSTISSASKKSSHGTAGSAPLRDDHAETRDYLAGFVSRTKSAKKTTSLPATTDTGSPIGATTPRQPLGAKSPNASPSPRKRKSEEGQQESGSPPTKKTKKAGAVASKPPKRPAKGVVKKTTSIKTETSSGADPYEVVDDELVVNAPEEAEQATGQEPSRRSARISKPAPNAATKSSIPTRVQVGSRAGAGRNNTGGLTSVGRNEQAELTRQTTNNTRRNKFKADTVSETLARVSEELRSGSEDDDEAEAKPNKSGNNVTWGTPLESFHESPKKKRGPKPKATQGKTGIAKPKAPTKKITNAAKERTQAAAELGMAGNGTPAKPITRARTRSQR